MAKGFYVKSLNRYVVEDDRRDSKINDEYLNPYYWKQGIGKTKAVVVAEDIFGDTFDITFE